MCAGFPMQQLMKTTCFHIIAQTLPTSDKKRKFLLNHVWIGFLLRFPSPRACVCLCASCNHAGADNYTLYYLLLAHGTLRLIHLYTI